jgi:hypothetical protein
MGTSSAGRKVLQRGGATASGVIMGERTAKPMDLRRIIVHKPAALRGIIVHKPAPSARATAYIAPGRDAAAALKPALPK